MKISRTTLDLLKNYATINANLLVREGSVLSTISAGRNIFSRAAVEEQFPREFAIYDLGSLLNLLTFSDDQEVEFGEESLTVVSDGSFEFFYSNPELINAPPDKTIAVGDGYQFVLTRDEITRLLKAAGIVQAPTLTLQAKKGSVTLIVGDPKNSTANTYRKVVGETDETFSYAVDVERLKIVAESYDVTVNPKFLHFSAQGRDLQYWIAVNTK